MRTFNSDTSTTNEDFISSILNSGLHRTPSEVAKKNTFTQTSYGGNISYNGRGLHLGANGVGFKFSTPIVKNPLPYNQYSVSGTEWYNYSVDYSYTYKNMHLFGEAAMDKNNSKAFLTGLLMSLDQRVDASLVYRNIDKQYQALYGNAFTESTFPTNENGLLCMEFKCKALLLIYASMLTADIFRFPYLRYRVDAPSSKGSEYLLQVTYRPNKQVEVYTRYRNRKQSDQFIGPRICLHEKVVVRPKAKLEHTQFSYKVTRELTLRNRVELVWFDALQEERSEQGFLTYFDASYKPFSTAAYALKCKVAIF
jgi:hypothetical protein